MTHDLLLVGGGLANALIAERLAATRPELDFLLIEAGPTLGGNHTWSFHGSDVTPQALAALTALGAQRFDGYDVRLPALERTLEGTYHSLRSDELHRALMTRLGDRVRLGWYALEVGATHVTLRGQPPLRARAVIDARALMPSWPCGWQKFLGQDLELAAPHRLSRPLLMDATVEQLDGFRFVYALPWTSTRVLVEDTLYSDQPQLQAQAARERIAAWVRERGWQVAAVLREEAAALPLPLSGAAPRLTRPQAGVAAGFFHATTGYSVPFAARLAERVAGARVEDAAELTALLDAEARRHWRSQGLFRLLNRMLFRAAAPAERARVFASFYQHGPGLISRFYAGQLTALDVLRVLARGAGTVPTLPALKAALGT